MTVITLTARVIYIIVLGHQNQVIFNMTLVCAGEAMVAVVRTRAAAAVVVVAVTVAMVIVVAVVTIAAAVMVAAVKALVVAADPRCHHI